ncbi:hypothetical protein LOAG_01012 [Loa loa]|uniref:Uncharacterized protein n=1 Tax=Loa loa TaxID=7209 RepID=A0A1S0UA17_LOALO|nr:hypothetical protein LOAG_01012 [Loa loa]EFO27464.1 hypothetical protein LOAG_01012 [Loa loa]
MNSSADDYLTDSHNCKDNDTMIGETVAWTPSLMISECFEVYRIRINNFRDIYVKCFRKYSRKQAYKSNQSAKCLLAIGAILSQLQHIAKYYRCSFKCCKNRRMISNMLCHKFPNSKIRTAYFLFSIHSNDDESYKGKQQSGEEEQEGINHALFKSNFEQRLRQC